MIPLFSEGGATVHVSGPVGVDLSRVFRLERPERSVLDAFQVAHTQLVAHLTLMLGQPLGAVALHVASHQEILIMIKGPDNACRWWMPVSIDGERGDGRTHQKFAYKTISAHFAEPHAVLSIYIALLPRGRNTSDAQQNILNALHEHPGEGHRTAIGPADKIDHYSGAGETRPPRVGDSTTEGDRYIDALETAPTAAVPPTPPPARHLQLDLLDKQSSARISKVQPHTTYRALVYVAPGQLGDAISQRPLDETRLPQSPSGHFLRLVFTPLWTDDAGNAPAAQVDEIHLPPEGSSTKCPFEFTTPASSVRFRIRLIVLHEYRVLQTLLLRAKADALADAWAYEFIEENVVSADFGESIVAPAFDAALIINDNPVGVPGFTGIAGCGAVFVEPPGLPELLAATRDDLGELNAPEDEHDEIVLGLDNERVHRLLLRLAMRGFALVREIKRQPQLAELLNARCVQVIDAISGVYFPVELLYDGPAPNVDATRCPHGARALKEDITALEPEKTFHAMCPYRANRAYYCPAAFWGFSRRIERQPSNGEKGHQLAQPTVAHACLQPLKKVLYGASANVRAKDLRGPTGLEGILKKAGLTVSRGSGWQDWVGKVRESPSLLVLLAHSLNSTQAADLPALEIDTSELSAIHIDASHVHAGKPPIVLLLGCSTVLPDLPFLNFVREFRYSGAAVTVGTLALIRGRQTIAFVQAFLAELNVVATEGLSFDEAFLRVKRHMLADGDPFVLSLVAYGDTGWRVSV